MTDITSLAQFRRALTVGSEWQFRFRNVTGGVATESPWSYRQVVHVQSNAVAFSKSPDPDAVDAARLRPHANASWLWHPKASRCSFPGGGIIRIGEADSSSCIEYRRLHASAAEAA